MSQSSIIALTYQDKFAKNNFTRKNRANFAPSTCQNLLRFIRPKFNSQNLFETNIFLSDLSQNIVFPCHFLLLTHWWLLSRLDWCESGWWVNFFLVHSEGVTWAIVGELQCAAVVAEVWSTFWSWAFVKILRLQFALDFEAEILPRFSSWLNPQSSSLHSTDISAISATFFVSGPGNKLFFHPHSFWDCCWSFGNTEKKHFVSPSSCLLCWPFFAARQN